jgi:hypothetical protein
LIEAPLWSVIVLVTVIICVTVIAISIGDPAWRAALAGFGSLATGILGYLAGVSRPPPPNRSDPDHD